VREGKFREDLYYRLNVLPIRVPPLRERSGDIPALVEVLAEDMALRSGSAPPELSAEAVALLSAQEWRGNIRELRNVLEQAVMRSDTHRIGVKDLEDVLRQSGVKQIVARALPIDERPARQVDLHALRPLADQVAEVERHAIEMALAATHGNKVAAAKLLGISRAKLYERLGLLPDNQSMLKNRTHKMTDIRTIYSRSKEKSF
jgi:DNA-binding NtrC family response regulator